MRRVLVFVFAVFFSMFLFGCLCLLLLFVFFWWLLFGEFGQAH